MRVYSPLVVICITFAAVSAVPSAADGPLGGDLYGKVNLSLDRLTEENDLMPLDEADEWQANSNASRVGVKGETELNPALKVIYKLEWEVNLDGDGADLKARNRFVGLTGGFGTVIGGKHDTPTKLAQHKIDLFNDLIGDIKNTFEGENRVDDIIMYTSPEFGSVSASLAFVPGEDASDSGASDAVAGDGLADGLSYAVQYDADAFVVALAIDRDIDGQDLERLVGQFRFGDFVFGSMLQHSEDDARTREEQGAFVSGAYSLGNNIFKAQFGKMEEDRSGSEEETLSLGYDHKFAATTKAFVYWTRNVDTDGLGNEEKDAVLGVGMEHKF